MKPLRFKPLLKQTLWGGNKIIPFKHLHDSLENVGESWEISGVPGNETIVSEGEYAGQPLSAVVADMKEKLVGAANYRRFGNEFPLLIKFIDAAQPLSIQVHPTDEIAHKQGKERGKTEMWYVMDSDPDASLLVGLKKIDRYDVKEGDCFFLPAGRIHSIGRGCFLCEIQQTSDVTYRIYDFKRKDKDGNYRQLHTKEAAESINYTVLPNYRTEYVPEENKGITLVQCPYFHTLLYELSDPVTIDVSALDSFIITIVTKGSGKLTDNEGNVIDVQAGDSLIFPATTRQIKTEGKMKLIETYV